MDWLFLKCLKFDQHNLGLIQLKLPKLLGVDFNE